MRPWSRNAISGAISSLSSTLPKEYLGPRHAEVVSSTSLRKQHWRGVKSTPSSLQALDER
jgi:hypothetical protein